MERVATVAQLAERFGLGIEVVRERLKRSGLRPAGIGYDDTLHPCQVYSVDDARPILARRSNRARARG